MRSDDCGDRPKDGKTEIAHELNTLLCDTAKEYQKLQHETRHFLGEDVPLQRILKLLSRRGAFTNSMTKAPDTDVLAMASLFGRASATFLPVIVPLAGRVEAGGIALYEPYECGFHPASARTGIGQISGDWVRRRSDGVAGTPDIILDLEYAHSDPSPEVIVEVTWVGSESVSASGGTTWTTTPMVSAGETLGQKFRSLSLSPTNRWVKVPVTIAASGAPSIQYDIWIRTTVGTSTGSPDDDDDDLIVRLPPTPLPVPVPSPTPTGIPTDIFAALDPDRWRQIEDRLGQFVRDTVSAFEGVLSRVDFLKDRTVLRDVSAALRERVRG